LIGGDIVKASQATAEVFFTAYKSLKDAEREAFIEKVVSDPQIREDFIDIALIEEAKKVKGKPISARGYFTRRRKEKVS
jgi:hypothetical protein